MATNKKTFVCEADNYVVVPSSVQTLQFKIVDPADATKTKKITIDPERLRNGKNKGGTNKYLFGRNVAIPRLRRVTEWSELGAAVEEYGHALEFYDSTETTTARNGKVVRRLVTICTTPNGKKPVPALEYVQEMLEKGIRLSVQKKGQDKKRPEAIQYFVGKDGLLLPTGKEKPVIEEGDEDTEIELSDEEEVA